MGRDLKRVSPSFSIQPELKVRATCDYIQIKLLICKAPTWQGGPTNIYGRGLVVASEETDCAFLRLNKFASRQKLLKAGAVWHPIHTSIQARALESASDGL